MRPGRLTGKNAWKRAGGSRRSSAVRLRKADSMEKQKAAQAAKAAKAAKAAVSTTEAGRVGNRPYARGRAYKPDRYEESE